MTRQSQEIICQNQRHRQITDVRDTDQLQYLIPPTVLEIDLPFFIHLFMERGYSFYA